MGKSWNPCSVLKALTLNKQNLHVIDECWFFLARNLAKRHKVHSSAGQGEPEECSLPSWQQKEVNCAWTEAYSRHIEGVGPWLKDVNSARSFGVRRWDEAGYLAPNAKIPANKNEIRHEIKHQLFGYRIPVTCWEKNGRKWEKCKWSHDYSEISDFIILSIVLCLKKSDSFNMNLAKMRTSPTGDVPLGWVSRVELYTQENKHSARAHALAWVQR